MSCDLRYNIRDSKLIGEHYDRPEEIEREFGPIMRNSIGREITKNYYKILLVTHSWLPEVFLLSCKLLLLLHIKLVAPHYALFDNHEIAVPIFLNDRTLAEVLSFALSTMVRAFPTNDIPILMLFRTSLGQTKMIRGTTDLDLLLASSGNAGPLYVNVVLVTTDRTIPFSAGGLHFASHSSDRILNGMAFSLTSEMEIT